MNNITGYLKKNASKLTIPAIIIILCVIFTSLNPRFLGIDNMISLLRQISMLCIMSCGVSMCMIAGGIDLSVGTLASIATVIWALGMTDFGLPQPVAILITVLFCGVIGYLNGLVVTSTNMNPMIATLGTSTIIGGVAYLVCHGGMPIYNLPDEAKILGQGSVGSIPIPIILMFICLAVNWFVLKKTYIGRYFYAVGSNEEAARLSGINSGRVKRIAYIASGIFTAICGIIIGSRVNSGQPAAGTSFQMNCLTACIVGGISIGGGEGGTFAVLAGALIVGIIDNGFTIAHVSEYWQQIARGAILIIAVALDAIQRQRATKAKRTIKRSN